MINDRYIDRFIENKLVEKNKLDRETHKSSGKLSASMLGDPLQWQILKIKGYPPRELEEYTLRKFLRGNQIEDWLVGEMPNVIEKQKFVEYRNCVGYIDAIVDTTGFDFPLGVIPHEIKSVSNAKFKRILKQGADRSHKLQACLYALALGKDYFAIDYIAADDLRVESLVYETKSMAQEVDMVIDRFNEALKSGIIPVFEAIEKWQENKMYCKYPDWANLTQEEINKKSSQI